MTAVTMLLAYGCSGNTYSDDSDPVTGFGEDGYLTRFFPLMSDVLAVAAFTAQQAQGALGGASSTGTSTSNVSTVAVASDFSITIQASKSFVPGQKVGAVRTSAPTTTYQYGTVKSYNSGTGALVITVSDSSGVAGPFNDWSVGLTAFGTPTSRQVLAGGLVTGGGNLTADRTLTVTAATASDVRTGTSTTTAVTPAALVSAAAFVSLTDASTVAWDVNNGFNATVTLGGNRTIGAPTNVQDGITYALELVQDATGSRVPTWNSIWDFGALGTPALQTAAGKRDRVYAQYRSASGKLHATFNKGA